MSSTAKIKTSSKGKKKTKSSMHGSKLLKPNQTTRFQSSSRGGGNQSMFMSRMMNSRDRNHRSKYLRHSKMRDGSSRFSAVREGNEPVIWRDGRDMTPLALRPYENDPGKAQVVSSTTDMHSGQQWNVFMQPQDILMASTEDVENIMSVSKKTLKPAKDTGGPSIYRMDEFNAEELLTRDRGQGDAASLDSEVHIYLTESPTINIFSLPSKGVSPLEHADDEREKVKASNAAYTENIDRRGDSDVFTTTSTQTRIAARKDRGMVAVPESISDAACQATGWDIFDSHSIYPQNTSTTATSSIKASNELNSATLGEMAASKSFVTNLKIMECAVIQNVMNHEQLVYRTAGNPEENVEELESEDEATVNPRTVMIEEAATVQILGVDELESNVEIATPDADNSNLKAVEDDSGNVEETGDTKSILRSQNDASKGNNADRTEAEQDDGSKDEKDEMEESELSSDSSSKAALQHLWTFESRHIEAIPVTCLDINPENQDLLISGHGSESFGNSSKGKIMFWTIKNPKAPLRIYDSEVGITSVDFSRVHPYLLAAGKYDGNVCVYDIRVPHRDPVLESELGGDKHTTPVWSVLWDKPTDIMTSSSKAKLHQRQHLFSIASDGCIKQWSMKKGFLSTDIMNLKRVPNLAAPRGSVVDNTIRSRRASGLCFEFPVSYNSASNSQYYVGTEDGIVHQCSVSYNEQVLRTYYGHTGPVYSVKCSPFDCSYFLTCSVDWTIKIWNQNVNSPLLDLQSNAEAVTSIGWSPYNACVFASAVANGNLEIWDLEQNKKDPTITFRHENEAVVFDALLMAPASHALFAGRNDGLVDVYRMSGVASYKNQPTEQQQARLQAVLQSED